MERILRLGILLAFVFFALSLFFRNYLSSPAASGETIIFTVPQNQLGFDVIDSLAEKKLIRNKKISNFIFYVFGGAEVESGGYKLTKNMNTLEILQKLSDKPDLIWFTTSACLRKEQIGEKLAKVLGWNSRLIDEWNNLYKSENEAYFEGVYYPDTYLIPVDETPAQVAQRFINRFNEKFTPLSDKFSAQNIKWTTGLKIASLIAREAAGVGDMNIISGIIWNRLEIDMPLQIDATMQYTLGKKENGSWWGSVNLDEKKSDSPYNSYLYKGLPPTPICSPDIAAIAAVVDPAETDCLYYLHDKIGQIHCAKTYTEHKENISKYLN